ncbi:MAG: sulfotransferase domain-containing protein [Chloroflexota bacterium]
MEKVLLHIGYHKSASTFLQNNFFPQIPVNFVFFPGAQKQYLHMIQGRTPLEVKDLHNWLGTKVENGEQTLHTTTVISNEVLSGHPHGYADFSAFEMGNNLKATFPNAKVLIIVRNQLNYLTSLYTFRVAIKGLETRSFDQFLEQEGKKGLFAHVKYDQLVGFYQKMFGAEKVLVLPMEQLFGHEKNGLSHIFDFIELEPQPVDMSVKVNVSTKSRQVLAFWRPVNKLISGFLNTVYFVFGEKTEEKNYAGLRFSIYGAKAKTTSLLNKLFKNGPQLSVADHLMHINQLEEIGRSNVRLQALTGIDVEKLGYPINNGHSD